MPSYETFNPEGAGLKLQRDYHVAPTWIIAEDQRELGNIASTAVSEKEFRRISLSWKGIGDQIDYVRSFFRRQVGPTGRFFYLLPERVASPDAAPVVEAVAGGSQGSRTIRVSFCLLNTYGRTKPSPLATIAIGANNLLKVTLPPFPANITQAVIFATQGAAGSEVEQTILSATRTWTQPNAALLLATTAPQTTNTTKDLALFKLVDSYDFIRRIGPAFEIGLTLQEVYQ